jgi:hypothetical protein
VREIIAFGQTKNVGIPGPYPSNRRGCYQTEFFMICTPAWAAWTFGAFLTGNYLSGTDSRD